MSTEHVLMEQDDNLLFIDNGGGVFDIGLFNEYDYIQYTITGLSAKQALEVAAGIIYVVWTSDPDEANRLVNALHMSRHFDQIDSVWNEIVRKRNNNGTRPTW